MSTLVNIGIVVGGRGIYNSVSLGVSSAWGRCDASYRLVHINKDIRLVDNFPGSSQWVMEKQQ